AVPYRRLMREVIFSSETLKNVKKPVEKFFSCKIVSSTGERNCTNDDALIGSYYSESDFFNICYTINSKWSEPNKTLQKVKRTDKIKILFYIDISDRSENRSADTKAFPKYNYPTLPSAQLTLHNNYASLTPIRNGVDLLGGKQYQITLKQEEKRLLPAPYQTNCTDYMTSWRNRGGIGPLNPIMVVEECKYNLSLEAFGCIPFSVDYPHNDSICNDCEDCF
ncbi:uncharacterized protein NPIL_649011, partial [Nephila pilipes]